MTSKDCEGREVFATTCCLCPSREACDCFCVSLGGTSPQKQQLCCAVLQEGSEEESGYLPSVCEEQEATEAGCTPALTKVYP